MSQRFDIDPVHSSVSFAVKHMVVATVRGTFREFSGHIESEDGQPTGSRGELVVKAASIDTATQQRDDHLRSADFLDAANHPEIRYVTEAIEPRGDDEYRIRGQLTIRDVTLPVELTGRVEGRLARDNWGNERVAVTVTGQFNRKDFGLVWNMPIEAGGWVVGDTVKVEVELAVIRKLAEVAV